MSKPFEIVALKRQIDTAADIIRNLTNQLGEERQNVVRLNAHIESLEKHNRNIEETLIAVNDEITALKASLANPVVLGSSDVMSRNFAIKAINAAGFTVKGE